MQEVSISQFKSKCFALISEVSKTKKPLRIMRRGKPIAEIVPPSTTNKRKLGAMEGTMTILGDIVSPVIGMREFEASRKR